MNNKILNKEALKAWILSKMVTLTNNLLATEAGVSAMDAAQGPVIQGQIDAINSNFGGMTFGVDDDGNYGYIKAGADTVIPFKNFTSLQVTVTWHVSMRVKNTPFASNNGTYVLKLTKTGASVISGSLPSINATTYAGTTAYEPMPIAVDISQSYSNIVIT